MNRVMTAFAAVAVLAMGCSEPAPESSQVNAPALASATGPTLEAPAAACTDWTYLRTVTPDFHNNPPVTEYCADVSGHGGGLLPPGVDPCDKPPTLTMRFAPGVSFAEWELPGRDGFFEVEACWSGSPQ